MSRIFNQKSIITYKMTNSADRLHIRKWTNITKEKQNFGHLIPSHTNVCKEDDLTEFYILANSKIFIIFEKLKKLFFKNFLTFTHDRVLTSGRLILIMSWFRIVDIWEEKWDIELPVGIKCVCYARGWSGVQQFHLNASFQFIPCPQMCNSTLKL